MSNKGHRSGGKFGGSHTTMIPLAEILADGIVKHPDVLKISPGHINAGLSSANGSRQVKVFDTQGGMRLRIKDNIACQEILVFTKNVLEIKRVIAQIARDKRVRFCIGESADE